MKKSKEVPAVYADLLAFAVKHLHLCHEYIKANPPGTNGWQAGAVQWADEASKELFKLKKKHGL